MDSVSQSWMTLFSKLTPQDGAALLLSGARALGLCLSAPLFASRLLTGRMRVGLAILIILCLPAGMPILAAWSPRAAGSSPALPEAVLRSLSQPLALAYHVAAEAFIGLLLGGLAFLVMGAVRGAASLLSDHAGFSLGGILDPQQEGGEPILRGLYGAFAVVAFLAADLHHAFIEAVAGSFALLPPGALVLANVELVLGKVLALAASYVFEVALAIVLPVVGTLLLVSLAQGFLARILPELEFFTFGFPLRAIVSLAAIITTLPLLSRFIQELFGASLHHGSELVQALAGG